MKVLVACEESQRVCTAFRELGHEAYSADIQEPSGGHPEWHILGDVLQILNPKDHLGDFEAPDRHIAFRTMDGSYHEVEQWDMIIAFPPCTHLAVSGARHFEKKRADGRQREGIEFFCKFFDVECEHVCIENPINIISGNYVKQWFPDLAEKYDLPRKAQQEVSPHFFGTPIRKKTHYWLKGLPELKPTKIVEPDLVTYVCKNGRVTTYSRSFCQGKGSQTSVERSKTPLGIAEAMAEQWGSYINEL